MLRRAGALGLTVVLAGCGAAPRPASRVLADCEHLAYRPAQVVIACGDGGLVLTGLRWSAWTATRAAATGTARVKLCVPDCATGRTGAYPVRVVFDAPVAHVLSRAVLTYPGVQPGGQRTETYDHLVPLAPAPRET
ncbi:MAG: hypothetical protein ACXVFV_10225 [Mycobacteriales bacterium]